VADDGGEEGMNVIRMLTATLGVLVLVAAGKAVASETDSAANRFGLHLGTVRLGLSSVYDSNINHEFVPQEDYGLELGVLFRIQSQPRRPLLRLEYRGGVQSYANTDRWDRIRHRVRLGIGGRLGKGVNLATSGELSTRTSSEDRELVNQITVSPDLRIRGDRSRRLRLYGAYRFKKFTETEGLDETIWYAGAKVRSRLWASGRLEVGYRYEDAESDTPSESYVRHRISADLEQALGRQDRLELGLQYRRRHYPEDFVDDIGDDVSREDERWVPSIRWTHRLAQGRELQLEYEYQTRSSNDPDKGFEAHRVELFVRWPLIR
jgi:hypothetical protein